MTTAKVFRSKNSQAIRLPKQIRVHGSELDIFRRGDEIILREKKGTMLRAFELLASLSNDLTIADRQNDRPQKRSGTKPKKRGRG
jgi:antitoxin VapB